MEEHFHIEVWDKANWSLNTFVGYESLLLHDVANGPVKQNLKIYDKTEKTGIQTKEMCNLSFNLNFEEVWDFKLKFIEFQTTDLNDRYKPQRIRPRLLIRLENSKVHKSYNEVVSTEKVSPMPYWQQVGKGIYFRGTFMELEQQLITLELSQGINIKNLKRGLIGIKTIGLMGNLDRQLQTELIIHKQN